MTRQAFERQINRRGPILAHYPTPDRKAGLVFSTGPAVTLLTGGAFGHGFALGWTHFSAGPGQLSARQARRLSRATSRTVKVRA